MKLEGSCHCGAVRFSVETHTPHPYQRCYCSICRKLAGGGGYAVNIMGEKQTLQVWGKEHLTVYRSAKNDRDRYEADGLGFSRRNFCAKCGTMLWNFNPNHPDWVYPFASAIDSPLPVPPEYNHIMLEHAVSWADVPNGPHDAHYAGYPDISIEDWHRKRALYENL